MKIHARLCPGLAALLLLATGPAPRADEVVAALRAAAPEGEELQSLFDGRSLDGWDGDPRYWSVRDGEIVGANTGRVPSSTYLFTRESHREFRLVFEVRQTLSPAHSTMHSAVAALGERIEDQGGNKHGFKGPLLMFCHDWGIWDAHGRNRVEPPDQDGPVRDHPAERKGDWNRIEILVRGNRLRMVANGTLIFDITDRPELLRASPLGLQLHANGRPQEFRFRRVLLGTNPGDVLLTVSQANNGD